MKESVRSVVDFTIEAQRMISSGLERWTSGEVELFNGIEGIGGPAEKRMTTRRLCAGWILFQHDSGVKAQHARVAVLHHGNGNFMRSIVEPPDKRRQVKAVGQNIEAPVSGLQSRGFTPPV